VDEIELARIPLQLYCTDPIGQRPNDIESIRFGPIAHIYAWQNGYILSYVSDWEIPGVVLPPDSFFQNRYFTLFVTVYRIIIELGDQIGDRVSC